MLIAFFRKSMQFYILHSKRFDSKIQRLLTRSVNSLTFYTAGSSLFLFVDIDSWCNVISGRLPTRIFIPV